MLSRTADHLYWMARFTERAENLARLLDVTHQMSLVPQSPAAANQNWGAILALNSLEDAFARSYDQVNAENVLRFMVCDPNNISSITSCLRAARENAHAVRGTLTAETWESCNLTWIELRDQQFEQILSAGVGEFFEWVKLRSALTRGVTFGTMLQDEALHFIRLGGLIERADNTARILDVKYHVLRTNGDEDTTDFYQWGALLRSLSAFEVYRKVYRDAITPARVSAERSLTHSKNSPMPADSICSNCWSRSSIQVKLQHSQVSAVSVPRTAWAFSRAARRQLVIDETLSVSQTMKRSTFSALTVA